MNRRTTQRKTEKRGVQATPTILWLHAGSNPASTNTKRSLVCAAEMLYVRSAGPSYWGKHSPAILFGRTTVKFDLSIKRIVDNLIKDGTIKSVEDLTCHSCEEALHCPYAYDPYNTNGVCLKLK